MYLATVMLTPLHPPPPPPPPLRPVQMYLNRLGEGGTCDKAVSMFKSVSLKGPWYAPRVFCSLRDFSLLVVQEHRVGREGEVRWHVHVLGPWGYMGIAE